MLSAFGCGALMNPPSHVARAYAEALLERSAHFDVVAFAVRTPVTTARKIVEQPGRKFPKPGRKFPKPFFHLRCPRAEERCRIDIPALSGAPWPAACHFPLDQPKG